MFESATPATVKSYKSRLNETAEFLHWYDKKYQPVDDVDRIDIHFTHSIYEYLAELRKSSAAIEREVRFFRRVLESIGVDPVLLPPVVQAGDDAIKDAMPDESARQLLNRCKLEMALARRRVREGHALASVGQSPLRTDGSPGSWGNACDRAWIMKRHIGRRFVHGESLRKEGQRGVLAGFEGRDGAEVILEDGTKARAKGFVGHVRWFLPTAHDIAPFFVGGLLRTGWNMSTLANLKSRAWHAPYPFRVARSGDGTTDKESHVFIVSYKTRGRSNSLEPSAVDRVPSLTRPETHAYRLLHFVDYMTAGVRHAIRRSIADLRAIPDPRDDDLAEIERLDGIKDDLFVFRSEAGLYSIRGILASGDTFQEATAVLRRAGIENYTARDLRDIPILHTYAMSGDNILVAQIVANHSDRDTTALYLRRRRTLKKIWEKAVEVFDASLALVAAEQFSVDALRGLLKSQTVGGIHLTDAQVNALLDPANTARWGNRCADAKNPPSGFNGRRAPDGTCVTQDCIDGCPYARWFDDSLYHVACERDDAERALARLGTESTEAASFQSRVDRCKYLMGRWDPSEVELAMQNARARISSKESGFAGDVL